MLTTTTTAETPVTVDGSTMKVQISDNLDPVTKENMMDMTFTTSVMDATRRHHHRHLHAG